MWPTISNIDSGIAEKIKSYPNDLSKVSNLTSWIRVFSGAKRGNYNGLIMQSNTNWKLLKAAGEGGSSLYGSAEQSGTLGVDWEGKSVNTDSGRTLRPSPVITSFNSKEGKDQISRTCDFSITCFSLEQLEYLQTYFMEPGYSIGVEWGWNTVNSYGNIVKTSNGSDDILNQIADSTLNNTELTTKRINSLGEYDIFLGFIVGSTVSNDGENFKIDVRLRGAPSIPTYLQSQGRLKKINLSGTQDVDKSKNGYGPDEISNEENPAIRRFKTMFNDLPADRQTESVKELIKTTILTDYINFDKRVTDSINSFINEKYFGLFKKETIEKDNIEINREDLFSTNRYIRFGLAIDILNKVGDLERYEIGNKRISFKININNVIIGAFPNMFSTKADKLIIPGYRPDFSVYFLNSTEVIQEPNGRLNNLPPKGFSNLTIFVGQTTLNEFGLKEKERYYGYLKNLYVNFDMFVSKLQQNNKNIREILLDILNEMSSAVNSFWNFQIVEGEFKKSEITSTTNNNQSFGNSDGSYQIGSGIKIPNKNTTVPYKADVDLLQNGDVEITVIDENWIGENPNPEQIVNFNHNGTTSPFLNSTLDIAIPADMANQIIMKRLGYESQKDMVYTSTRPKNSIDSGSFFNSETDLFMKRVTEDTKPKVDQTNTDNAPSEARIKLDKVISSVDSKINNSKTRIEPTSGNTKFYDSDGNLIKMINKNGDILILGKGSGEHRDSKKLLDKVKEEEKSLAEQRLSMFLKKIDVVPIPTIVNKIDIDDSNISGLLWKQLEIYCYDDSDFFEKMRNYYFDNKYKNTKPTGLSHPLPIKYSFTILGNSGIRRGDTFNIDGIPSKYKDHGLFQVVEIEHSISDMKWTTTVTGQYRQIQ
jgi:hypothetical protein